MLGHSRVGVRCAGGGLRLSRVGTVAAELDLSIETPSPRRVLIEHAKNPCHEELGHDMYGVQMSMSVIADDDAAFCKALGKALDITKRYCSSIICNLPIP